MYESLSEILLIGSRVGDIAQAHMSFSSLHKMVSCKASAPASSIHTIESKSPVSRNWPSAASMAFLRYSVAGKRMPRAST